MKSLIKYQCEICGRTFSHIEEAKDCEEYHKKIRAENFLKEAHYTKEEQPVAYCFNCKYMDNLGGDGEPTCQWILGFDKNSGRPLEYDHDTAYLCPISMFGHCDKWEQNKFVK